MGAGGIHESDKREWRREMNMNKAYMLMAVDIALWVVMIGMTWHYITCPAT